MSTEIVSRDQVLFELKYIDNLVFILLYLNIDILPMGEKSLFAERGGGSAIHNHWVSTHGSQRRVRFDNEGVLILSINMAIHTYQIYNNTNLPEKHEGLTSTVLAIPEEVDIQNFMNQLHTQVSMLKKAYLEELQLLPIWRGKVPVTRGTDCISIVDPEYRVLDRNGNTLMYFHASHYATHTLTNQYVVAFFFISKSISRLFSETEETFQQMYDRFERDGEDISSSDIHTNITVNTKEGSHRVILGYYDVFQVTARGDYPDGDMEILIPGYASESNGFATDTAENRNRSIFGLEKRLFKDMHQLVQVLEIVLRSLGVVQAEDESNPDPVVYERVLI